jgi:hypothetical protein
MHTTQTHHHWTSPGGFKQGCVGKKWLEKGEYLKQVFN